MGSSRNSSGVQMNPPTLVLANIYIYIYNFFFSFDPPKIKF